MSVNIVDFDSSIIRNQIANELNEHPSQGGTYADYIQKNSCRIDAEVPMLVQCALTDYKRTVCGDVHVYSRIPACRSSSVPRL